MSSIAVRSDFSLKLGVTAPRRCADVKITIIVITTRPFLCETFLDSIRTYVSVMERLQQAGFDTRVWCQDLWAVPSGSFRTAGVVPFGSPFGAASSVWCSNRCVNALGFLVRTLLLLLCG